MNSPLHWNAVKLGDTPLEVRLSTLPQLKEAVRLTVAGLARKTLASSEQAGTGAKYRHEQAIGLHALSGTPIIGLESFVAVPSFAGHWITEQIQPAIA
jgi:hypothetical protein